MSSAIAAASAFGSRPTARVEHDRASILTQVCCGLARLVTIGGQRLHDESRGSAAFWPWSAGGFGFRPAGAGVRQPATCKPNRPPAPDGKARQDQRAPPTSASADDFFGGAGAACAAVSVAQ